MVRERKRERAPESAISRAPRGEKEMGEQLHVVVGREEDISGSYSKRGE